MDTTTEYPQEPILAETNSIPVKPKRRRLKRLLLAILVPLGLMLLAVIILGVFGNESIEKTDSLLDNIWLPATLCRFVVYCLIAYALLPFFIRKAAIKNDSIIYHLNKEVNKVKANEDTLNYVQMLLSKAEAQAKIYHYVSTHRFIILLFLLAFDVITLQLPYFLKSF